VIAIESAPALSIAATYRLADFKSAAVSSTCDVSAREGPFQARARAAALHMSPMAQSGLSETSACLSAFGAKRTCPVGSR
jgi:hypothetical protein